MARPRVGGTGHAQRLQPDRMNGTAPNGTNAQRRDATPTEVGTAAVGPRRPAPASPARAPNRAARKSAKRRDDGLSQVSHGTRRRGPPPGVYRREVQFRCAKVALRTLCLRVAGSTVLRTPLGPRRAPCIACPTSNMRCRPAHSWSRVCPRLPVGPRSGGRQVTRLRSALELRRGRGIWRVVVGAAGAMVQGARRGARSRCSPYMRRRGRRCRRAVAPCRQRWRSQSPRR